MIKYKTKTVTTKHLGKLSNREQFHQLDLKKPFKTLEQRHIIGEKQDAFF